MFNHAVVRLVSSAVIRAYLFLTMHHKLHQPEHIGAFAGSYLPHTDWNHP